MGHQFTAEAGEADVGRGEDEEERQNKQVHQVDDGERKERATVSEIGLTARNHGKGECRVECPSQAEQAVENSGGQFGVGLEIVERGNKTVSQNDKDAVDRNEVRRERDPSVDLGRDNVSAVAGHPEFGNATAHDFDHEGVGQFVAEDVDDERFGQSEINNEPTNQPEAEEPELGRGPEMRPSGRL